MLQYSKRCQDIYCNQDPTSSASTALLSVSFINGDHQHTLNLLRKHFSQSLMPDQGFNQPIKTFVSLQWLSRHFSSPHNKMSCDDLVLLKKDYKKSTMLIKERARTNGAKIE